MANQNITRRQCLLGACGLGLSLAVKAKALPSKESDTESYPRNASEALIRLKNGNLRFMNDKPHHTHQSASWRSLLVESQKPFASILGCSDSRVPPELLFDVGFGDLFTIRVAGNIIAEDVIGSLQFAAVHLHTSLIVVLGHEGCGAVSATLDEMLDTPKEPKHIESLIQLIKPGLKELNLKLDHQALLNAAVEANVRWSMRQLLVLPEMKRLLLEEHVSLVGGVYELATGRVRFIN